MPRPPFLPLKAAWIKASERGSREGGPKSGPLRLYDGGLTDFMKSGRWSEVRPVKTHRCRVLPPILLVGKVGRSQAR